MVYREIADKSVYLMKRLQYPIFLLFFLVSVATLEARMPTSVVDRTPREYWQLLFLYESTTAPGQSDFILRLPLPFYGRYQNMERGYTFHHVLYPLFYSHGTNHWKKWTFINIFTGDSLYHKDTKEDSDLIFAPFFKWGRGDSKDEKYFSIFPFFGTWKDKFSHSEFSFVLWPIYSSWTHNGDYKAKSILWPLTMWGSSKKRSDFRLFLPPFIPIYSQKIYEGKYRRYSVFWPIFQWGEVDLDKKEPRGYLYFWPFYARKWSANDNLNVHGILPLFIMPLFSWGTDKVTNTKNVNLFWFLYQYGHSDNPKTRKHMFFPFYGRYEFASREFSFITPLYANLKTHSVIYESETNVLFPIYWKTERYYLKDWSREKYFKIWPLFQYVKDNRGNFAFNTLSLWPMRSDHFDRIWGPLYGLVEYRRFENGDRYFSTMFRFYSQYWNKNEFHLFLAGFEYHKTPRYISFEFLGGLLGFRHEYAYSTESESGASKNYLKLFWLKL